MNWSKLRTRLLSALILVCLLFLVTFAPVWVFTLACCAVCFVVLYEMMVTFHQDNKRSLVIVNYIFASLYMLAAFLRRDMGNGLVYMITILFLMTLLILSILDNEKISFQDVCAALFLVMYSVIFVMHLSFIRHMMDGLALVFLAFIGAWIPDTAAYFAGNFFGKHKLIEKVSPHKTVEGAIGAVVGALVAFPLYGWILTLMGYTVHFLPLIVLGVLCSVFAQFGDLAASVMKRAYNAKDFGTLIPGHGGLVDRIDSLIFITPLVYYFITYFPIL